LRAVFGLDIGDEPFCFRTAGRAQDCGLKAAFALALTHVLAPDCIRAPTYELDQGAKEMQYRLDLTECLAIARREPVLSLDEWARPITTHRRTTKWISWQPEYRVHSYIGSPRA